jgi:hypothetical protein
VVKAEASAHGGAFIYADSELQEDKAFVLKLIAVNNDVWTYADYELREDEDFANAANEVISATTKWRAAVAETADLRTQLAQMARQLEESQAQALSLAAQIPSPR